MNTLALFIGYIVLVVFGIVFTVVLCVVVALFLGEGYLRGMEWFRQIVKAL
jgi:hypothetical protein